jgi:regulator of cell morphogenesis and NO signaling
MTIDVRSTLGDLVTADPRRSRILEAYGIDYCCQGSRSLDEAAMEAQLNVSEIAAALELADAPAAAATPLPAENAVLAHDIVDTHHAFMWSEMPRLQALVEKVHGVHGGRHPELAEVHTAFEAAVADLEPHMTTEERVVFPAISRLEKSHVSTAGSSLAGPIGKLRSEHDVVGDLFKKIRSLTGGYAAPEDACNSYRAMLTGLEEMESDLHDHIHKENNILFPRVLELEQEILAGR